MLDSSTNNAGLNSQRLSLLRDTIAKDITNEIYHGAVVLVAHHGDIQMHEAIGNSDKQRPTQLDDVFSLMSITKQFTTVLVLSVIEQGHFALNTRVADIIPEFGVKGKNNITVYQLLTHMSGMNPELPANLEPGGHISIEKLVAAASEERLHHRPGRTVCYNPYSAHSILAEMVVRTDPGARQFGRIMDEDLFVPLQMQSSSLSTRPELKERKVPIMPAFDQGGLFDPEAFIAMNQLVIEGAEFAAAGAIGSAMDLFRFTEMLRQGGSYQGQNILSRSMVKHAVTNQTGTMPNDIFDFAREMHAWPDWPAYIGLTFFLRGEGVFPTPMGHNTSPATFCGEGAGSTLFWVDPEKDLTFICLTAGIMDEAENILRFQRLSDIVVSAWN